jgi:hypothetical protein
VHCGQRWLCGQQDSGGSPKDGEPGAIACRRLSRGAEEGEATMVKFMVASVRHEVV